MARISQRRFCMENPRSTDEQAERLRHRDRRTHGISASQLRRELRAADRRLFEATAARRQPPASWFLRMPLAFCALAGLSLVAAGGAAPPGAVAADIRLPANATPSTAGETHTANLVGRDVPSSTVEAAPPRAASLVAAPVAPRRQRNPTHTRRIASAPTLRAVRSPQHRPEPREDKGVIARVRFTWDNPFR